MAGTWCWLQPPPKKCKTWVQGRLRASSPCTWRLSLVSRHRSSVGLHWPSERIAALHRLPIRSVLAARCALRCAPMAARSLRHLIGDATLATPTKCTDDLAMEWAVDAFVSMAAAGMNLPAHQAPKASRQWVKKRLATRMMNPLAGEKRPLRTHDEPGSRPTMKPVWRLIGSFGQDQFAQFGRLQAGPRAVVADGHRLLSLQRGAAVDGGGGARCRRCIVDARVGAQRSRRLGGGAKHGRGAGHGGWHGVVLC